MTPEQRRASRPGPADPPTGADTAVNPAAALPLRTESERMAFCDAYFQAVGAPTVYRAEGYREYELPRDVDKELTDRPYFWLWVEKTQQQVQPTILRLAFNEAAQQRENQRLRDTALAEQAAQAAQAAPGALPPGWWFRPPTAELITLGSFRLEKICQSLDVRGRFACVRVVPGAEDAAAHEALGGEGAAAYPAREGLAAPADTCTTAGRGFTFVPWLVANALVSYRCDLVEQVFVSVGCCLVNGQLMESFHRHVGHLRMVPAAREELLRPARLSIAQGMKLVRRRLEAIAHRKSSNWADAAMRRLQQELRQLHTYYRSILPDVSEAERPLVEREQQRRERELVERIHPRIEISLRQLAVVGLAERTRT